MDYSSKAMFPLITSRTKKAKTLKEKEIDNQTIHSRSNIHRKYSKKVINSESMKMRLPKIESRTTTFQSNTYTPFNKSRMIHLPPLPQIDKRTIITSKEIAANLPLLNTYTPRQNSIQRNNTLIMPAQSNDKTAQIKYHKIKTGSKPKQNSTFQCNQNNVTIPQNNLRTPGSSHQSAWFRTRIPPYKRKVPDTVNNIRTVAESQKHSRSYTSKQVTYIDRERKKSKSSSIEELQPISGNYLTQRTHKKRMKSMHDDLDALIYSLTAYSGLPEELVRNIIAYAGAMADPDTLRIDEVIFSYELSSTFGLSDTFMINNVFKNCKLFNRNDMSISEYSRVVCAFLSEDVDCKADLVFDVYDMSRDGEISKFELAVLLKPTMVDLMQSSPHDFLDSEEEELKELIGLVLKLMDQDMSGSIDKDEFKNLVHRDSLILQLLGPCLPDEIYLREFRNKLIGRSSREVAMLFANVRQSHFRMNNPSKVLDDLNVIHNPFLFNIPRKSLFNSESMKMRLPKIEPRTTTFQSNT